MCGRAAHKALMRTKGFKRFFFWPSCCVSLALSWKHGAVVVLCVAVDERALQIFTEWRGVWGAVWGLLVCKGRPNQMTLIYYIRGNETTHLHTFTFVPRA